MVTPIAANRIKRTIPVLLVSLALPSTPRSGRCAKAANDFLDFRVLRGQVGLDL